MQGGSTQSTRMGNNNMHADHASAPLDQRAHTFDISNIGAERDRERTENKEFLATPGAASDFTTGTRTGNSTRTATASTAQHAQTAARKYTQHEGHTQHGAQHTETIQARASYVATPGKGATVEEKRRFVMWQLDALGDGAVVLGKFVLLDAGERCHGGA